MYQGCCGGHIIEKSGQGCCKNRPFHLEEQDCCDGQIEDATTFPGNSLGDSLIWREGIMMTQYGVNLMFMQGQDVYLGRVDT